MGTAEYVQQAFQLCNFAAYMPEIQLAIYFTDHNTNHMS